MANFKKTSRYKNGLVTKNRSGKNYLLLREPLNLEPGPGDTFINVTQEILQRPDLISQIAYNNPEYWWVIYEFNSIKDPLFELKLNDTLRIPPLEKVLKAIQSLGE